jgi:hypothetical protein
MVSSTLFAQHSLEKVWETDSLTLRNPESVLYDTKSNSLYVSSMGAGTIVRIGLDGKVSKMIGSRGLHPTRISLVQRFILWQTSSVAVIDVDKLLLVKRIRLKVPK